MALCKHFLPWCVTCSMGAGQHEINDACVNNDKRTIKHCDHTRKPEDCPEYQPEN